MEQHPEQKEKTPADLFLQALRTATEPMHKALEANRISKSLMSPTLNLTDYAFYLQCMGEVIRVFDGKVLPSVNSVIPDTEQRRKFQDITADLEYLYRNGAEKRAVHPFTGFVGNPSLAYVLGYAYVIEGSTLGGRVILKHVAPTLKLEDGGTRFFAGYGAETGKFWKDFLQHFCMYVLQNNQQEEAIQGAKDGFTDIGRHFASHD